MDDRPPWRDHFEEWKAMVGLPASFPCLLPIEQPIREVVRRGGGGWEVDDRLFVPPRQVAVAERTLHRVGEPVTVVRVALGHGCTTFATYVAAQMEQDVVSHGLIPVLVSVDDMVSDGGRTSDGVVAQISAAFMMRTIEEAVHRAMVRSLVTHRWERVLGRARYGRLIGAAARGDAVLEERRHELASALEAAGPAAVGTMAPHLAPEDPWHLLEELHEERVGVTLHLDLSPTPAGRIRRVGTGETLVDGFCAAMVPHLAAALDLVEQRRGAASGSRVDLVVFACDEVIEAFQAVSPLAPEIMDLDWYRPADVFAMLAHHYRFPQEPPGGRPGMLAAVVDSSLVRIDRSIALDTAVARLARRIRSQVLRKGSPYHVANPLRPPHDVPRRLGPRPDTSTPPAPAPERYRLLGHPPFNRILDLDDATTLRAGDLPVEVEFEIVILVGGEANDPDVGFLPTCRASADGAWIIRAHDTAKVPPDLGIASDAVMAEGMETAIHRHPRTSFVNKGIDDGRGFEPTLHVVDYDIELDGSLSLTEALAAAAEVRGVLVGEAELHVVALTRRRLDELSRPWTRDRAGVGDLIGRVETASSAHDKGIALEELVVELVSQVDGFTTTSRVRTTTEEIDIEIVNTSEAAFWKRSRDLVLVECKNLAGRVGKDAVVSLRDKVRHRRGRSDVGVLVSWNGFAETVAEHELRDSSGDVTILLLDGEDLRRAVVDGMEAVLHQAFLEALRR